MDRTRLIVYTQCASVLYIYFIIFDDVLAFQFHISMGLKLENKFGHFL